MWIVDSGVWHLEEDLKHLRALLPDRSVHCCLPIVVPAVRVCTALQQHANHLCPVSVAVRMMMETKICTSG